MNETLLRRLKGVLFRIQLLWAASIFFKAMAVWCVLATFIRGRLGWETVHLIAAASFAVFFLRDIPSRRAAMKTLERLRPDSDFRFTTFFECLQTAVESPGRHDTPAWEILTAQVELLLRRSTPYLSIPGFAFSFRSMAAAIAVTLLWPLVSPQPETFTTRLPSILRIKIPSEKIRAGMDVEVLVYSEGRISSPRLLVEPAESPAGKSRPDPAVVTLAALPSGIFSAELPRVSYPMRLTAEADAPGGKKVVSPSVLLEVVRPPVLAFHSVLVAPPAYTGMAQEEIRTVGKSLTVFPGTELTLRIESDIPISSAAARFDAAASQASLLKTSSREQMIEVRGEFRTNGVIEVTALSASGLSAEPPFRYAIDTDADRAPTVVWILPKETSMDAPAEGMIPMKWQVEDDFGLSAFRVRVTTADGEQKYLPAPFLAERQQVVSYLFEVSSYLSYAGSEIEVRAEASDNDRVSGPKTFLTTPVRIRAPTVMDVYQRLTEQGGEVTRMMEKLSGESTRLLKKMTAAARTMKAEGKMAWQMEQELVSMAEAAQQAKREAEQALAELGRRTENASRQNLLSRETLQKLSSIGAMMNNLLREDFSKAQRELERAVGAVRMDDKERAMMSAKFNMEQFVDQVERTHRMLSRVSDLMEKAQAQKAVQDLADRAEKALDSKNADRLDAMSKEAAALMPKLQELARDPAFSELKKALTSAANDLPKQFEQAAKSMKENSGQSSESQKAAQKAAEDKLRKSLDELRTAMQKGAEKSETSDRQNAAEKLNTLIDGIIFALGELQAGHEYFTTLRSPRDADEYSRRLQKAAALEPVILEVVREAGATAERMILFDPRPLQMLQRAVAALHSMSEQDEDPNAVASKHKLAYRYCSVAGLQLLEIAQDLQKNSGGQKGAPMNDLSELLQQLISAQQQVNSRTQMSMQLGQFGQSLEQLAFQQELIRRSMEAEAGRFSDLQEKLGRVDQLMQDMRKAEEELRKVGPTPDVQARQQKILNKLMELQQSMTNKDEQEEKFEAEPFFGKPTDTSPLRLDRRRIDEKEFLRGLPPEYRDAGKKYLRSIFEGEHP